MQLLQLPVGIDGFMLSICFAALHRGLGVPHDGKLMVIKAGHGARAKRLDKSFAASRNFLLKRKQDGEKQTPFRRLKVLPWLHCARSPLKEEALV